MIKTKDKLVTAIDNAIGDEMLGFPSSLEEHDALICALQTCLADQKADRATRWASPETKEKAETVTLPREIVAALIDMALTGDAGMSGWMDDDEVEKLRAAAVAIGMEPMDATPRNFKCKYRGGVHAWGRWLDPGALLTATKRYRSCEDCREYEYEAEVKS